jgi:phage-related protein
MSYNPFGPFTVEFVNERVEAEILDWPRGIRSSFTRVTERMVTEGPDLGMPYTRAFGAGLFEIRARGREGIGRAFFCTLTGRRVIVLHGFIKKTEETPSHEIQVARKRQKEIQDAA